jgi:hypothetical protein
VTDTRQNIGPICRMIFHRPIYRYRFLARPSRERPLDLAHPPLQRLGGVQRLPIPCLVFTALLARVNYVQALRERYTIYAIFICSMFTLPPKS